MDLRVSQSGEQIGQELPSVLADAPVTHCAPLRLRHFPHASWLVVPLLIRSFCPFLKFHRPFFTSFADFLSFFANSLSRQRSRWSDALLSVCWIITASSLSASRWASGAPPAFSSMRSSSGHAQPSSSLVSSVFPSILISIVAGSNKTT